MPGFNRTGPGGAGPMTGERRGLCSTEITGYGTRNFRHISRRMGYGPESGYGRRLKHGFGRGFGWWGPPVYEPVNTDDSSAELNKLKARAVFLESELAVIHTQIKNLEKTRTHQFDSGAKDA